ncbi:MAG: PspC domain-containing protein [Candidatus Dormibacteria bacterium]|jgi:signal transduction histidine kinase
MSATSAAHDPGGASAPQDGADQPGPRRYRFVVRSRNDRVLTGTAAGLAEALGLDPLLVRLGLAVLTAADGAGIVLYLTLWLLSVEPSDTTSVAAARTRPRNLQIAAVGCIVAGTMLILRDVGLWFGDALVWPVAVAAAGSALIWVRSDQADRHRWARISERLPGNPVVSVFGGRVSPIRIVGGGLLVAAGMTLFLVANRALASARTALLAVLVTAVGLGLILGPWILRLARDAGEERRQRIRSEERAEIAAHLHDSVLHTLALIQRSEDPADVAALARRQERELRAWLDHRPTTSEQQDLRGAVDALASRVEEQHHVTVDTVVVGDTPVTEHVAALLLACQEAATNAARHSGASRVSIYIEADGDGVTAYVRDEGAGFDINAVPADRRGIAESVIGRMRRHGGSATITSRPGHGTEVQLQLPRAAS